MLEPGYYNMDCMEGMAQFPDKHFDLAIVDPPYGIGITGKIGGGKKFGTRGEGSVIPSKVYKAFDDSNPPCKRYFEELFRVSKNQIIWGANHLISKIGLDSPAWVVWDKDNSGDFADCELAWTSFKSAVRKYKYRWNGMLQENMKNKEIRIHPTQKPVQLYKWLLKKYANPNDLILDTHVGSASSLIACEEMGFQYVGFELDSDYYRDSQNRLTEFRKHGMLLRVL